MVIEFYYFIIYLFIFIFGAILGSFLNVLIFRIHNDEQWIKGRSYCPNCKKELGWKELIPLLSYIWQGGKCKKCGKRISTQYPIVEFLSALLAIFIAWKFGFTFQALLFFFVGYLMMGSFFSDLKFMELPEIFSWSTFALGVIYQIFFSTTEVYLLFIGLLFGFFFFWLQFVFTKGKGLGEGDIRLGLIIGIFFGWPLAAYSILTAYIIATILLLPLVILKKIGRKTMVPLGVFLIPVFLIFLYWNNEIISFLNANFLLVNK